MCTGNVRRKENCNLNFVYHSWYRRENLIDWFSTIWAQKSISSRNAVPIRSVVIHVLLSIFEILPLSTVKYCRGDPGGVQSFIIFFYLLSVCSTGSRANDAVFTSGYQPLNVWSYCASSLLSPRLFCITQPVYFLKELSSTLVYQSCGSAVAVSARVPPAVLNSGERPQLQALITPSSCIVVENFNSNRPLQLMLCLCELGWKVRPTS